MSELLLMLQRITIFVLAASLFTNLFAGTEYKKYFQYVIGLIVIAIMLSPVIAFFSGETNISDYLGQAAFSQQEKDFKNKIKQTGEEQEKKLQETYKKQIQSSIASEYGIEESDCEIKLSEENEVEQIRIHVHSMPSNVTADIQSLSLRYGTDEDNIYFVT